MNKGWVFVSMTAPHLSPPPPPPLLVLILWDVSVAHVCECQWEAALWLFYELHYWFPILLRTENVIMHRPRPNPLILAKHIFSFSSLFLSLVFHSVAFHQFVFHSCLQKRASPPPSPDLSKASECGVLQSCQDSYGFPKLLCSNISGLVQYNILKMWLYLTLSF